MPMGKVVSIDLIRHQRQGGHQGDSAGAGGGGSFDGLSPSEYRGVVGLFDMAQESGIVATMKIQPYGGGFLFRAFSMIDPSYTLFEIRKVRRGRVYEYHGRVRHQRVVIEKNFFSFMSLMRAEILRLIELLQG